jgi:chemotaxis protein MotB
MHGEDKKQPIIIKKKKAGHGGHHGGSWKVAYADFVTAMMAFFLLMWLLGSTSQAQREGIADYFKNPAAPQGPGGASTSMIKFGGALELPRGQGDPFRQAKVEAASQAMDEEETKLDELMEQLKEQIESTPSLKDFKDQLLLDITSEGLRIQIVDKENRPMFDLGGTRLKPYTQVILHELARTIEQVPNFVSVSGHTDATPYVSGRTDYGNWELSADRANAARREMIVGGMGAKRFGRVVGLADSVLFDKDNPINPVNRRISIIVMNKATRKAIGLPTPEGEVAPKPELITPAATPDEPPSISTP